jgi:hypothetical protein
MTINPQLIIIKDHKYSPRLTYYLMNSKLISIQTQNELNGGSTPMISQNSVENFIIPISSDKLNNNKSLSIWMNKLDN